MDMEPGQHGRRAGSGVGESGGAGMQKQGLLRFGGVFVENGGPIPTGAQINYATLEFEVTNRGDAIGLHRMLVPWGNADTWSTLAGGIQADDDET